MLLMSRFTRKPRILRAAVVEIERRKYCSGSGKRREQFKAEDQPKRANSLDGLKDAMLDTVKTRI